MSVTPDTVGSDGCVPDSWPKIAMSLVIQGEACLFRIGYGLGCLPQLSCYILMALAWLCGSHVHSDTYHC